MYRTPTNPVFIHMDVATHLEGRTHLRQRCNMRLRDLMAKGGLMRAKSTKGNANQGWLRTPLGGQRGNQFYLWWTRTELPAFEQQARKDEFRNSIWVRAVRHHDDHNSLPFGDVEAYYPFEQPDIIDDDLFSADPWTEAQRRAFTSKHSVNVIYGHPGSGKTSTLLKVIEDSHNQRILFSTLSRELTAVASEYINVMAPVGTEVLAYDYLSLLGILCREDVTRPSLSAALRNFVAALGSLGLRHDQYGPWKGNEGALYAEIRSTLLGRAVPGEPDSRVMANGMSRLNGKDYLELRGHPNGVGETAAQCALQVLWALEKSADMASLFPEMFAAAAALRQLKDNGPPRRFEGVNRIIFDEVQDISLLEANVIVELGLALTQTYRQQPLISIAGDEGQTTLPSGFSWSWLNRLLYQRIRKPAEFELDSKLRTPRRISRVIENSLTLYKQLERGDRPGNQRREVFEDETDGQVCYVELPDYETTISLLETLSNEDIVKIVIADNEVPNWIPAGLRNFILTPIMVKGLEYSNICVLNPGAVLESVAKSSDSSSYERLTGHRNRVVIDNLRVALSRATEVLVFLDVAPNERMRQLSKQLLGEAAVTLSAQELLTDVLIEEMTPRERIETRLRDALGLLDIEPALAWHRAVQSQLLHNKSDRYLAEEVNNLVVRVAARLLVDGFPEEVDQQEVLSRAFSALSSLNQPVEHDIFSELVTWTTNRHHSPIALLRLIQQAGRDIAWLRSALAPIHQTLLGGIQAATSDLKDAEAFTGRVDEWLETLTYSGDVDREVIKLRTQAFNTLHEASRTGQASTILDLLPAVKVKEMATQAERNGDDHKALYLFGYLNMDDEVSRIKDEMVDDLLEDMFDQLNKDNISAVNFANAALALIPNKAQALYGRGSAQLNMGDFSKALKDFNSALPMLSDDPGESAPLLVLKGKALNGLGGRATEEVHCYTEAIRFEPDDPLAYTCLAESYYFSGEIDKAITAWENVLERFPDETVKASLALADIYSVNVEDYENAITILSNALENFPSNKALRLCRFELFEESEREGELLADLEILANLFPDDTHIVLKLAFEYALRDKMEDAEKLGEYALSLDPDDYEAHLDLAGLYMCDYDNHKKKPAITKALRYFNKAITLRGDYRDAEQARLLCMRAMALKRRGYSGDKAKAFQDRELATRYDQGTTTAMLGPRHLWWPSRNSSRYSGRLDATSRQWMNDQIK